MNRSARWIVAILLALAIAAISAMAALVGAFWGFGLTCDDSCSRLPPWRNDPDAWQWRALGWTGIAAFATALLFLVSIAMRRRIVAGLAGAAWIALAVPYIVLFDESGLTSNVHRGWIGLGAVVAALVSAVVLAPPRRP